MWLGHYTLFKKENGKREKFKTLVHLLVRFIKVERATKGFKLFQQKKSPWFLHAALVLLGGEGVG